MNPYSIMANLLEITNNKKKIVGSFKDTQIDYMLSNRNKSLVLKDIYKNISVKNKDEALRTILNKPKIYTLVGFEFFLLSFLPNEKVEEVMNAYLSSPVHSDYLNLNIEHLAFGIFNSFSGTEEAFNTKFRIKGTKVHATYEDILRIVNCITHLAIVLNCFRRLKLLLDEQLNFKILFIFLTTVEANNSDILISAESITNPKIVYCKNKMGNDILELVAKYTIAILGTDIFRQIVLVDTFGQTDIATIPYINLAYFTNIGTDVDLNRFFIKYGNLINVDQDFNSRTELISTNVNTLDSINKDIHNIVIDTVCDKNGKYKHILYESTLTCYDMGAILSTDTRLIEHFDYFLHIPQKGHFTSYEPPYTERMNSWLAAVSILGGATLGEKVLLVVYGDTNVEEFSLNDMHLNYLKNSPLTKHITFLHLSCGTGVLDNNKFVGYDIMFNSMYKRYIINKDEYCTPIKEKLMEQYEKIKNKYSNTDIISINMVSNVLDSNWLSNLSLNYDNEIDHIRNIDLDTNYNIEYINIKHNDPKDIVDKLKTFYQNYPKDTINILLNGNSGTGKSQYAAYIANKCNKKLITIVGSNILDMWVGESEKKINRIFTSLTNNDILLIEEADALFTSRENLGHRMHDKALVNEFLAHLERYKGTLIITTNYLRDIDKAFLRRFNLKLEFLDIKRENIHKILMDNINIFKLVKSKIRDTDLDNLRELRLGDIGNVNKNIKFFNIKTAQEYIDALKREITIRKEDSSNSMGFLK